MSIESLLDDLRKNEESISKRLYKKRCGLARETDHDSFTEGAMGYAHLEGFQNGLKVAISAIEKHIGADTNLPTSAKRSDGKDINVSANLPTWCKEGQWVFYNERLLARIEGFEIVSEDGSNSPTTYVVLMSYDTRSRLTFTRLPEYIKPVWFRSYTFEEAKGLLGKVMETACDGDLEAELITRVLRSSPSGEVIINDERFDWLAEECNATIDGIPIGVPVIDVEAMKEAE